MIAASPTGRSRLPELRTFGSTEGAFAPSMTITVLERHARIRPATTNRLCEPYHTLRVGVCVY